MSHNRQAYNQWSDFYDSYPNSTVAADQMHFPRQWAHLRGVAVLEIGCGTGRHTVTLARQGNRVTGLDLSPGMLARARAKTAGLEVTLIEGDLLSMDSVPGGPFAAAVTSLVLEHIKDLETFFARVAACLAPGGEFFLSEIHPQRADSGVLAHFVDEASGQEVHLESYAHTPVQILEAAECAGFTLLREETILGDQALANLNPRWQRHQGQPMIAIWVFGKRA